MSSEKNINHHNKTTANNKVLESYFDFTSDLAFFFNREGQILYCNQAVEDFLLHNKSYLITKNIIDFIDISQQLVFNKLFQKVADGQNIGKFELTLRTKQDNPLYVKGGVSKAPYIEGQDCYVAVFFDNSEKIHSENAQQLYNSIANLALEYEQLEQLLEQIHKLLKEYIGVESFHVAIEGDDKQSLYFPYYFDESFGGKVEPFSRPFNFGLTEYTLKNKKPIMLDEKEIVRLSEKGKVRITGPLPKMWLGVPLKLDKKTIGVVTLKSQSPHREDSVRNLEVLDFISGQLALVIERKRYEEKMNDHRARLNSIVESSSLLIWSVNEYGSLTSFNKNYSEVIYQKYGLRPEIDPAGKKMRLLLADGEYAPYIHQMYLRAFQGKEQHFEIQVQNKNGSLSWRETFLNPIISADGVIREVSGISLDITQKKFSELILQENEEKFRNIFESFQDVYFRIDITGKISMVSPSAYETTGFMAKEILGRNLKQFFDTDESYFKYFRELLRKGRVKNLEAVILAKEGTKIPVLANIKTIFNKDRKPIGFDGVIRDVSILKKSEEELRSAKDLAERSLKIKELFLANMSHEIRTPMNGIIAMIDLLNETKLDVEQKDYILTLKNSSQILLRILNDILDLSKLEAGKMELHNVPVSLKDILQMVKSLFSQQATNKNIKLLYEIANDIPKNILVDETRLMQVLSNLVSNAIKFTDSGYVKIIVSRHSENPLTIKFNIIDTGIGISESNINYLFQNFNQLDSTITKSYAGTGLGLSISKELCRLMGGEIGVISQEGKGSDFWFTISTSHANEELLKKENQIDTISGNHFDGFRPSILLVDDNEVNRRVASTILTKAGCDVILACNGLEAIEKVYSHAFDLIFMDIQMPEMDGISATKEIKKNHKYKFIPIIAMTAYSMKDDEAKFLAAGLDHYVPKPITADLLIRKIKEILGVSINKKAVETLDTNDELSVKMYDDVVLGQLIELGGVDMVNDLMLEFCEETTEQLHTCRNAFENKDFDTILTVYHSIKGTSGTIGLMQISKCAEKLEKEVRNGKHDQEGFMRLYHLFEQFKNEYKTHLNTIYNG